MTDRTIRKTDELYRSQQERIAVLEEEKGELVELNEQLQAEIYSLKRMASYRGDNEGASPRGVLSSVFSSHVAILLMTQKCTHTVLLRCPSSENICVFMCTYTSDELC